MKEFERFKDLFYCSNIKKYNTALENKCLKWWKDNFNSVFGTTTRCDTKTVLSWHWSLSTLCFGIPKLGDYHYAFVIKMIHFEYWQVKEWKEGFKYGRRVIRENITPTNNSCRDGNPYSKIQFYSHDAWDAGYIQGLDNYHFIKFNQ
jgi:hypothetical protein